MNVDVIILPVGRPTADALTLLAHDLRAAGFDAEIGKRVEIPKGAFDERRNQHRADVILDSLPRLLGKCVLGVADVDFYVDGLNFALGLAERHRQAAVISLARLRMGADAQKARERALKEAVHEICHTLGLGHCDDRGCVMHFSNSLADTDRKTARLCTVCQAQVNLGQHQRERDR